MKRNDNRKPELEIVRHDPVADATPQARDPFRMLDQVNALAEAREADPDLGFVGRVLALCSLPRTNPGNQDKYIRRNGPFTLVMTATGEYKGSGADRIVGAIRSGVRRGDTDYAAMT